MAYKTKSEKRAWRKGLLAGLRKKRNKRSNYKSKTRKKGNAPKKPYKMPPSGAYNSFGRINDGLVDDLHGPVVFWEGDEPF